MNLRDILDVTIGYRFAGFVSKYVINLILCLTGVRYIADLNRLPLSEFSAIGISAFALLAALAATSFSFARLMKDGSERDTMIYSGEKFFHSSILLVQVLMLKYATSQLAGIIQGSINLGIVLELVASLLYTALALYAALFFYWGLDELNLMLWQKYQQRLIRTKASSSTESKNQVLNTRQKEENLQHRPTSQRGKAIRKKLAHRGTEITSRKR